MCQSILDGLRAQVPVIHHERARPRDRWNPDPVAGQSQRPRRLAACAPLVQHSLQAHQAAHSRQQRLELDRLGQEVVRSRFEPVHAFGRLAKRGNHHDWDMERGGIVLQPAAGLVPVHPRHHDVQQNEIGLPRTGKLQGLVPVRSGGDLVIFGRQLGLEEAGVGRHIVNDQDAGSHWK